MKHLLSKANPFGNTIKGLVWEYVQEIQSDTHLDYGSSNGALLVDLLNTGVIQKGHGLDAYSELVEESRSKMPKAIQLDVIKKDAPLPFDTNHFDSITMIGVLEHIADQQHILKELHRVLKPTGNLILVVPGKHAFSFLDTGNFKFIFPRLHKLVYTRMHSKSAYETRYVECPDGLFGDIDVQKRWHQHFSLEELGQLLEECGLEAIQSDGIGLFRRVILNVELLVPGPLKSLTQQLIRWDASCFHQTELLVTAKKASTPSSAS